MLSKYFIRQFIIYFLLLSWFLFSEIKNISDEFAGKKVETTVKFVYEAF